MVSSAEILINTVLSNQMHRNANFFCVSDIYVVILSATCYATLLHDKLQENVARITSP